VRIADRPAEWKKASADLDDDPSALKRAPRGFAPDHPMIEDIKRKSFTASLRLSDGQMKSGHLMRTFIATCKELVPLMRFLAGAVGSRW